MLITGTNLDPFSCIEIASGPMFTPQTITNNPAGGPILVMQNIISQLPPPILTNQAVPPATHGGSGPSTYTTHPIICGGSGPSTCTVPPTTLGGTGPSTMVPQVPPVMQVHHVPANPTTNAAPSHINLGSNLPFMARLNFPDLARSTNDPIQHQTFLASHANQTSLRHSQV